MEAGDHHHQVLDPYDIDDNNQESASITDYSSNVDTSKTFRSVKEAVAIFGERLLAGDNINSPKTFTLVKKESYLVSPSPNVDEDTHAHNKSPSHSPNGSSQHYDAVLNDKVKEFELELEQIKAELKLLIDRELETELATDALNAKIINSISKRALAKVVDNSKFDRVQNSNNQEIVVSKEDKKMNEYVKMEKGVTNSPSVAQFLCIGERETEGFFLDVAKKKERKSGMKKKPIIPLVTDLFSRKKESSTNGFSLYSSSHLQWN